MRQIKHLLIFLGCSFISLPSYTQETVYISDIQYVPLRSGQGNEFRIVNAALKTGTKLTRLEQSDDGAWSKVVTENDQEGWIRTQYLTNEKVAQIKLSENLAYTARLAKENAELKEKNAELSQENQALSLNVNSESTEKNTLAAELERLKQLSANAIDIDRRYQELLEKHAVTQTQRDSLAAENEHLKNDQRLSFMLYGAGILLFGMLLAVILPALRPKKRFSEWA